MALAGIAATCVVAQPVSRNLPVGQQPMAVAVNESTKRAYIVSHNSSSVTVIDGRTRTAIATIKTGAGPEAIAVNEFDGEVRSAFFLELLLAAIRRDRLHQARGVFRFEVLGVQTAHATMMPDDRRLADRNVQVAGLQLDDRLQQFVDVNVSACHWTPPPSSPAEEPPELSALFLATLVRQSIVISIVGIVPPRQRHDRQRPFGFQPRATGASRAPRVPRDASAPDVEDSTGLEFLNPLWVSRIKLRVGLGTRGMGCRAPRRTETRAGHSL